ncbi:MAG: DUF2141 domain-containing protein [Caulobacter sp.]
MTSSRMKTAALFLSIVTLQGVMLAALPPGAALAAEPAAEPATLTITFEGITQVSGEIRGQLFASEAAYGGKGGAPAAMFALPVAGGSVSTTVTGLAPGRYAIRAFHDVDGDGQMGANPFGIPTEPFAFSNNARGAFGPATWSDAAFEVACDTTAVITID